MLQAVCTVLYHLFKHMCVLIYKMITSVEDSESLTMWEPLEEEMSC
jgi:hypothetical protein